MDQPNQYEDKEIERIMVNILTAVYNVNQTKPGVVKVVDTAVADLQQLITKKQLEARIDERTQLAIEMALLTNFTEKAFGDITRSNHERIAELKKGLQ